MINVTKTYIPDKKLYQNYVDRILSSGWLTNNGAMVQELESELKSFLGANYIILTVNGTCALQLAFKLLNLKGEVITTPFTFAATISSLVWEGLSPVFADIDQKTLNLDPFKIQERITRKTTAILPVHVFGNPCAVEKIDEIAKANQLPVIYDAAHAFDVKIDRNTISQFGDVAVFSFHSTKIFHTVEGGAVVVRTKELYEKALLMRNFGIPGYDKITELGVNFKMNEFQAAMGLCVLKDFEQISRQREKVFLRYQNAFRTHANLQLQAIDSHTKQNYAYFPIIFKNEKTLLQITKYLNDKDIYPRRYFYPSLNTLPYLITRQSAPVSESIASRILCLPLFHDLDPDIQDQIIDIIIKYA